MAVLRKNKTSNYTVIDNNIFKNKTLSLKAKGILCLMLSLPDDWDYSLAGLTSLSSDGVSSVRSALKELEDQMYFKRHKLYENGKLAGVEYIVSETPMSENLILENLKQENLILEKESQLNTNLINNVNDKVNIYNKVIDELNAVCGTNYKSTSQVTRRLIDARLKEGFTEDDFFVVIAKKASMWKGTKFEQYLRPQTLFGTKFESYLNEKVRSTNGFLELLKETEG